MGQLGDILLQCIGVDLCHRGMMDQKLFGRQKTEHRHIWDGYVFQKGYTTLVFESQFGIWIFKKTRNKYYL